jgi:hypothetical protein
VGAGDGVYLCQISNDLDLDLGALLPFTDRTAQRLMAVAADQRISNGAHVSDLPTSWGTLYELTKLDNVEFDLIRY